MEAESSSMATTRSRKKRKHDEDSVASAIVPQAKAVRKRGLGKLSGLLSMPLDVLFEECCSTRIFGQLKPFDLLKLARMTKEFRRVLMHKSSISVWKTAQANVPGLPDCPPEMTEPQWANLAFDPHCHFCFTTGVRGVEWRLRIRACSKCIKIHSLEIINYDRRDIGEILANNPSSLQNRIELLIPHRQTKKQRTIVLEVNYRAVKAQLQSLSTDEKRIAFVKERGTLVKAIHEHAALCERWAQDQTEDRETELHRLKTERKVAIIAKLEGLGWGKDIASIRYPDSLDDHKLVRQPRALTDRIWRNIEGPIIEFMGQMRAKRLAREHAQLILTRKCSAIAVLREFKNARLPCSELYPEGPDFCDFGPIKAILEQPSDVTVDKSSFAGVVSLLPALIADWRSAVNDQLTSIPRVTPRCTHWANMTRLMQNVDDDFFEEDGFDDDSSVGSDLADRLNLATTVFQCSSCYLEGFGSLFSDSDFDELPGSLEPTQPLWYPQVLGHSCNTRVRRTLWFISSDNDPSKKLLCQNKNRRKWSCSNLRIDDHFSRFAEQVVQAADLDPATTTVEDMDQAALQFICSGTSCIHMNNRDDEATVPVYGWREAVAHHAQCHILSTVDWEVLRPGTADIEEPNQDLISPTWLCVHCRDLPEERERESLARVKEHIDISHGNTTPEINIDYYEDYNVHHYPTGTIKEGSISRPGTSVPRHDPEDFVFIW